jgi:hypothetical protein
MNIKIVVFSDVTPCSLVEGMMSPSVSHVKVEWVCNVSLEAFSVTGHAGL